jgi:ABC-2 type transport system permease protein
VTDPVGPWKAAVLLCRLNLRRQLNQLGSIYRFRKASPGRAATARKPSAGRLLTVLVAASMLFSSFNLAHQCIDNMKRVLGSVQTYEEIRRGWLGVETAPVTEETAARLGITPRGALITAVAEDGPAKAAGLRSGDVVVEVDGKNIAEPRELSGIVAETPVGKVLPLTIVHDGSKERRIAKVGLRPGPAQQLRVRRIAPAPGTVLAPGVMKGAIFVGTLLLLAALFMALVGREIAQPQWDLEWLVTLPLPLSTLLSSRLIERAVTNSAGFIVLGPFLSSVAWECGYTWTAPLLGFGLTIALLFTVATVQTLVDTGLRLSVSPPKLRNLQAVISVVAAVPLLLAMAMGLHDDSFVFGWVAALPDWMSWLPAGLVVRALASADAGSAARWDAAMAGEVVATVAVGYGLLHRQLRHGVVAAGAREAVRRMPAEAGRAAVPQAIWSWLPVVQRRELRLLGRDRAFMAQTLLFPAVVVGSQVFLNAGAGVFVGAVAHPENLAAIAFALAAYTLMASAFQTLSTEGQALWILFAVPHSLESVLWQKAKLWAAAATVYPLLVFAIAGAMAGAVSLQFVGAAVVVLLGVPIFAVIATALGVFGCDPLAQEARRRIRPTFLYLYVTLASLYTYAVYASTVWQRAAMVILTALLATALWQRARDHLDFLLDPTASPPSRVSVSDGMIAALMFFVLQALVDILLIRSGIKAAPATVIWIGFAVAGATTYAATQLVYRLAHTTGVPRMFGSDMPRALLWGVAGGIVASLVGVIYIEVIAAMNLLPSRSDRIVALAIGALAVVAAPVFEEFIFRGLIFGGLRRSLGPGAATLASAAIFAIVHPPLSVIPVFAMGVCAALIYERTKVLVAPMLVHAIYNAVVVGFQWNLMQ